MRRLYKINENVAILKKCVDNGRSAYHLTTQAATFLPLNMICSVCPQENTFKANITFFCLPAAWRCKSVPTDRRIYTSPHRCRYFIQCHKSQKVIANSFRCSFCSSQCHFHSKIASLDSGSYKYCSPRLKTAFDCENTLEMMD